MQETQVRSLGREDPLEKEMATHFNIFAWRIPWTEEPGGLQSMGSQRIRHGWAISTTVALSVAQRKTGSSHSASWLTSAAQRLNSLKREYCCSVSKSGPTLCDPMDCTTPGLPVSYHLPEFARVHVRWIRDTIQRIHLILCHPLLLLSFCSIFPSIRIFSSESALCIWWPKYWSFSFSISPSNEYSGLISF